ncbi:MAG: hybrid sensor histidine kinase/response regulator, partial [Nitrospirales bacterium]
IEAPGIRVTRGKPANGTIALRAFHRGNSVTIEVEDDGAGIDVERVKAKAISQGLLHPDLAAVLPDAEALKVIFAHGFSTVDDVGTQAGRGVGLDVVRRTIENLQGRLDVRTETGKGTTFSLTLPLTVLISMALLVRAGVDRYAIPLHGIREVMMPAPNTIKDFGGRRMLQLEEESVEVRPLAELLGDVHAAPEGPSPVVIVKTTTGLLGVLVDELLGRQEIVVKTLGNLTLFQASCFGGASIDPDGRVILVLEVGRLGSGADKQPALSGEALQDRALLSEPELPEGEAFPGEEKGTSRILLIDDSLSVRKFVGRMLEGAGYEVETAVDGEEGLRRAFHEPFGLIITDLEMPKLNGFEVIQALRQRPATKALPILVMTTRAGDKHRHIALNAGANAYIPKPVDERTLIQELERWLGQGLNGGS